MATNATTRRTVLALLLAAGGAGGSLMRPDPVSAALAPPLRLPERPLRLARLLQRGVGETAVITVRREWEVWFEHQGRGIVVSGRQLMAEVSAPPHLADLARIEQQRDASGLFPIMLTEQGILLPGGEARAVSDEVGKAMRAAEALIARQRVPTGERERYRHYLGEVHRAGTGLLDRVPPDLFFPTGEPIRRSETLALPEGMIGSFWLDYMSEPHPDAPWLKQAERHVVTRIAGLERVASEVWTLGEL